MITEEVKRQVVAQYAKGQPVFAAFPGMTEKYAKRVGPGEPTSLVCICGAPLQMHASLGLQALEAALLGAVGAPPKHRKRRIQKKWEKQYREKCRPFILMHAAWNATVKPVFVCTKCGARQGYYRAIANNLFKVEPMPPGALPIYDKDPGVAQIVAEGSNT